MNNIIANVNPLYFYLAATHAASTEETRYYLNGIFIQPDPDGGVFITATNGHTLMSFHDPEGSAPEKGLLVHYGTKMTFAKKCKITNAHARNHICRPITEDVRFRAVFRTENDHTIKASIVCGEIGSDWDGQEAIEVHAENLHIDGTFPDWIRVVPVHNPLEKQGCASYNAIILAAYQAVAKTQNNITGVFEANKCPVIKINSNYINAPALIDIGGYPNLLAVIMPMRGTGETPDIPEAFRSFVGYETRTNDIIDQVKRQERRKSEGRNAA